MIKKLTQLIFHEQRGAYSGPRRQVGIKVNPGSFTEQLIKNSLEALKKRYSKYNYKVNEQQAAEEMNGVLSRTSGGGFFTISMWPKADGAILSTRSPSRSDNMEFLASNEINIRPDLATMVLTDEFYKILKKDLEGFGLIGDVKKSQRIRITLPSDYIAVGEKEDIAYEDEKQVGEFIPGTKSSDKSRLVAFGELYPTGNIKLQFVDMISSKTFKEYLEMKGYDTKGQKFREEENDDDDDDLNEQREVAQSDADTENAETPEKRESPVFKTKKAVVIDNVSKLIKSLDELTALIKENPEVELSDLISVFSDLVNTLNENGLVAK